MYPLCMSPSSLCLSFLNCSHFRLIALSFCVSLFCDCCPTSWQQACLIEERKGLHRGGKSEGRVKEKEMGRRWKLLGSWEQDLKFTAVYYLLEVITSIMKVRGREEMEKGERKIGGKQDRVKRLQQRHEK